MDFQQCLMECGSWQVTALTAVGNIRRGMEFSEWHKGKSHSNGKISRSKAAGKTRIATGAPNTSLTERGRACVPKVGSRWNGVGRLKTWLAKKGCARLDPVSLHCSIAFGC